MDLQGRLLVQLRAAIVVAVAQHLCRKEKQFGKELGQKGWLRKSIARPVSGHCDFDVTRDP